MTKNEIFKFLMTKLHRINEERDYFYYIRKYLHKNNCIDIGCYQNKEEGRIVLLFWDLNSETDKEFADNNRTKIYVDEIDEYVKKYIRLEKLKRINEGLNK